MRILGINDSSHDAAVSVIDNGEIVFAAHSERYNKQKNTYAISDDLIEEVMSDPPDLIAYFEKRPFKRARRFRHGGINGAYQNLYKKLHKYQWPKEVQVSHHYSHAAAGYFTSTFAEATVVVLDAIGEFETATIWDASGNNIRKRESLRYPISFGLFYSAFTDLVGLKPGFDEYVLMGMAAYGDPSRYAAEINKMFPKWNSQTQNFHHGVNWPHPIICEQDKYDIAAAVQLIYQNRLIDLMRYVRRDSPTQNLVFMGGCALNCSANTKLLDIWDEVWIMPNPGDAGSSLGAALAIYGSHIEWRGPYLGHDIGGDFYPSEDIIDVLLRDKIVAVANGRAEFGPRALGNRSLLADPRPADMKDRVNQVKKREPFRPFAPIIMEDHVSEWFEIDRPVPYMQFAVKARFPELMPAVVHHDGTSRIQTVNEYQHPGLYDVLSMWYHQTGMPVLLNTSLNVRDQPMLNDELDALVWQEMNPQVKLVT